MRTMARATVSIAMTMAMTISASYMSAATLSLDARVFMVVPATEHREKNQ